MSALTQPAATILRLSPQQERQRERARLAPSVWEGQIYYRFEELALFAENGCSAGRIDGWATVTFDEEGTWGISAISIELDNGRCGEGSRAFDLDLPIADPRFAIINEILGDSYSASITERVVTELEENV